MLVVIDDDENPLQELLNFHFNPRRSDKCPHADFWLLISCYIPIFIPLLVCYPHNFRESHIFGYIHIGGIPITLLVKFSKTSRMGGLGMPMYT